MVETIDLFGSRVLTKWVYEIPKRKKEEKREKEMKLRRKKERLKPRDWETISILLFLHFLQFTKKHR